MTDIKVGDTVQITGYKRYDLGMTGVVERIGPNGMVHMTIHGEKRRLQPGDVRKYTSDEQHNALVVELGNKIVSASIEYGSAMFESGRGSTDAYAKAQYWRGEFERLTRELRALAKKD